MHKVFVIKYTKLSVRLYNFRMVTPPAQKFIEMYRGWIWLILMYDAFCL